MKFKVTNKILKKIKIQDKRIQRLNKNLKIPKEKSDDKYNELVNNYNECSKHVFKIFITLVVFCLFCLLCLAYPDYHLLSSDSVVIMPFVNVELSFNSFITISPLMVLFLSFYLHVYIYHLNNFDNRKIDWKEKDLRNLNLSNSSLRNADFTNSNLEGSNFENADLTNAIFRGANLKNVNLKNSILDGADFSHANLTNSIRGSITFSSGGRSDIFDKFYLYFWKLFKKSKNKEPIKRKDVNLLVDKFIKRLPEILASQNDNLLSTKSLYNAKGIPDKLKKRAIKKGKYHLFIKKQSRK